jgi:hypothetical protein
VWAKTVKKRHERFGDVTNIFCGDAIHLCGDVIHQSGDVIHLSGDVITDLFRRAVLPLFRFSRAIFRWVATLLLPKVSSVTAFQLSLFSRFPFFRRLLGSK